jgi:hypothetical protein
MSKNTAAAIDSDFFMRLLLFSNDTKGSKHTVSETHQPKSSEIIVIR